MTSAGLLTEPVLFTRNGYVDFLPPASVNRLAGGLESAIGADVGYPASRFSRGLVWLPCPGRSRQAPISGFSADRVIDRPLSFITPRPSLR